MKTEFYQKLRKECLKKESRLCIGLDIDYDLFPKSIPRSIDGSYNFIKMIIDSTHEICASYKLNLGFFEQFGFRGYELMEKVVEYIGDKAITIADGKRGDIGNSSKKYAQSIFNQIGFDSATVSPYMGRDSITPFTDDDKFGAFVLCLTSNSGSADLQKKIYNDKPVYFAVLDMLKDLKKDNIGIVVGATQEDEMVKIRSEAPNMPWLIPGIGKQGGNLEMSVKIGNKNGAIGIINVSRDILYHNNSTENDIHSRTLFYHNQIKGFLNE